MDLGFIAYRGTNLSTDTTDLPSYEKREYLKQSEWFIRQARFYSLPFFYGWTYQVWGTYNWLSGRKKRAEKLWDKGLRWFRTNKNNPGGDKYRIAYLLLEEAKFLMEMDN